MRRRTRLKANVGLKTMKKVRQSLQGRERLVVVFWIYCVLGGVVIVTLPFFVAEPLYEFGLPMWAFVVIALMQVVYLLWAHVSLWTCAFNSQHRMWGYAARSYVCVVAVAFAASWFLPRSATELEVIKLSSAQQSV